MQFILAIIFGVIVSTSARPQDAAAAPSQGDSTPVPIISKTEDIGVDGSFNFSFEAGNGIHVEERGYLKKSEGKTSADDENDNDIQVIEGSYSYTAPDGQNIVLKYIADENGFRPEGDHLPTPPPSPAGLPAAAAEQRSGEGSEQAPVQAQAQPQPAPQPEAAPAEAPEATTAAN